MSDRERQIEAVRELLSYRGISTKGRRNGKRILAEQIVDLLAAVPSEVTDEQVERAAKVQWEYAAAQRWDMLAESQRDHFRLAMRAALEAAGVQPTEEER